jgi:hypothetical protein
MGDAAGQEPKQIIIAAADEMAFHQFLDVANTRLELGEIVNAMVGQRDFGEDRYAVDQLVQVDLCAVSGDVTCLLQALHALQARAGRKPDLFGEVQVSDCPVLLQLHQNIDIDAVEFGQAGHERSSSNVTCGAGRRQVLFVCRVLAISTSMNEAAVISVLIAAMVGSISSRNAVNIRLVSG